MYQTIYGVLEMNMKYLDHAVLTCCDIEKVYKNGNDDLQVIKPSGFSIEKGTFNLILGRSGCGKTTLLNILAGLESPTKGKVYYQDKSFYDLDEQEQDHIRGTKYGFIFQSFHLIPELTVADNIKVPILITQNTFDKEFFENIITLLGMKEKLHNYPSELSGGEQQRAAIARAMINKPNILFADEPTGNLDLENSRIILRIMEKINKKFNTTIILVTHDVSLMQHSDKKIYLKDGIVRDC